MAYASLMYARNDYSHEGEGATHASAAEEFLPAYQRCQCGVRARVTVEAK